ncbi:MAG: DUF362 domain-containing protein [Candidatus Omnitrophota bacterium]|nr:DUF362 domain-containing protein [Candidatus Omnitrophota bacterium]
MGSAVYYVETNNSDSPGSISKKLAVLIEKSDILKIIGKDGFTGVKLHFGEDGNTGHINSMWVKETVKHVRKKTRRAFLTDSNVLYKNSMRANSVDHLNIAREHGFSIDSIGIPTLIADGIFGRNFTEIPISKKHFKRVLIASDIAACDSLLVLTHVTGHFLTGLGGAIKNLGMGCASRRGKYEQHAGVVPDIDNSFCVGCGLCALSCPALCMVFENKLPRIKEEACIGCGECAVVCKTKAIDIKWSETLANLQEKMVEYACGAVKAVKGKIGYINFLIKVTKDCDCLAKNAARITDDFGILASLDPVAIDKASIDFINRRDREDVLKTANPQTDWLAQLKYAEDIGLGNMSYNLVSC